MHGARACHESNAGVINGQGVVCRAPGRLSCAGFWGRREGRMWSGAPAFPQARARAGPTLLTAPFVRPVCREQIAASADVPTAFAQLASTESHCGSARSGGDLGWFG